MTPPSAPLRIDIISDVMCPWCVIGYRQLAEALAANDVDHEIHWHPFELNPNMPPEGQNLRAHLIEKYRITAEKSDANRANMIAAGNDLGFVFNFDEEFRMHNTFNTHQLLHWADAQGRKHDLKQALFHAHFTDARDLSDDAVLVAVAGELGLDQTEAAAVLADQRHAKDVRELQQFWTKQGIQGVPAVVFNQKHFVTGAQGVENYKNMLGQLVKIQA